MPGMQIQIVPIYAKRKLPNSALLQATIVRELQGQLSDDQRRMAEYPPQVLTKTGYRRTNTLKRSWNTRISLGRNIVGALGSNRNVAPYNVFVQGPRRGTKGSRQVRMFANAGWKSIDAIVAITRRELPRRIQRALSLLVK